MSKSQEIHPLIKKEITRFIEDRIKHIHKGPLTEGVLSEYQQLLENIDKLGIVDEHGQRVKTKRSASPRNEFIGKCMRNPDKGGEGKDMTTCSVEWSEMSEEERKQRVERIRKEKEGTQT